MHLGLRAQRVQRIVLSAPFALALISLLSALLWLCGAPFLQDQRLPKGPALAVLLAAVAPALVRLAWRAAEANRHALALSLLVLLGGSSQLALHSLVPAGPDQALQRLTHGHGEFLRVAAAHRGHALQTLRDYDDLFSAGQLGKFPGSKPPGALGVYMLLDQLAQLPAVQWVLAPLLQHARATLDPRRTPESAALGMLLFPLLTFLAIVPLVWLGRSLYGDPRAGYGAAVIAFASPAVLLIDQHLDGALYPGVALLAVALVAHATRTHRALFALAGGAVAMLGVYCTFGLLALLPVALGVSLLPFIERLHARASSRPTVRLLAHPLLFLAGAGLSLFLLIAVLHFQPVRRFESALAFHTEWKRDVPTALWRVLSLAEFALYLAPPLAAAFLLEAMLAGRALLRGQHIVSALFSLGMLSLLLTLAFTQGTNEVARLWLFMVPLLALAVSGGMYARSARGTHRSLALWLCACQAALTVLMKVTQPW